MRLSLMRALLFHVTAPTNFSALTFSLVVSLLLLASPPTWAQNAQTAKRKVKLNQYKRLHQDALQKIVRGDVQQAIQDLDAVLEKLPEDMESHYMLAVAYARLGETDKAIASVKDALDVGLPASRFVTGTRTGLEPLREREAFKQLVDSPDNTLAHGPMLGCLTDTSVRVWVRTAGPRRVTVVATPTASTTNQAAQRVSAPVSSTEESDHTVEVELTGLKPNTQYTYRVKVGPAEDADDTATSRTYDGGTFRTIASQGAPIRFRVAFGGGAGFVPQHEHMWNTIADESPDMLMLLGDNVYSDAPKMPEMQHYCYYRRQSRPEFQQLVAKTPTYTIWDDHDFGTNDCSGGPEINTPAWKLPVYKVYRNNWVNPYYGGGDAQPGCYYDFYWGDVHFVMLDGRYYRNLKDPKMPTMLGPVQRKWLLDTIRASKGKLLVLCSPVPWVFEAKGDSKDTWNGFQQERNLIMDYLDEQQKDGVILMSADRHRSDLWKLNRPNGYPLYELNSSRLTNQHVHKEMPAAVFSYNKKQSFGTVDFDTTKQEPTVTYRVVSIDGEEIHRHTVRYSELQTAR